MEIRTRNINTAFRSLVWMFHNGETEDGERLPLVRKGSRYGDTITLEEPCLITYEQPRERVLFNTARDVNPFALLYESLWTLTGRNDVAPLAFYFKRAREFSDDGKTWNDAYGGRWRHAYGNCNARMTEEPFPALRATSYPGQVIIEHEENADGWSPKSYQTDQLQLITDHLRRKPDSRRAVLQMWNVENDLLKIDESRAVCCNTQVLLSLRDETYSELDPRRFKTMAEAQQASIEKYGSPDYARPTEQPCVYREGITRKRLDITVVNRSNDLVWGLLGANYVCFSVLQEYLAAHLGAEVGRFTTFSNNLHVYTNNWQPEAWMECEEGEAQRRYPPDLTLLPLVKDPKTFDTDLPRFVERFSGKLAVEDLADEWEEPFFQEVAQPLLIAFACHKVRDYHGAFAVAEMIAADDWRIAAEQWLRKRCEAYERKGKSNVS